MQEEPLQAHIHPAKEIKMKANSLFVTLIVAALLAVTALTVREALATTAVVSNVDSATRSYTSWAKAAESESNNTVDSATRSYSSWAKAMEDGSSEALVPVTGSNAVNSATRSYTSWARSVGCGADVTADKTIDSATRSYIAWAKALEVGAMCH